MGQAMKAIHLTAQAGDFRQAFFQGHRRVKVRETEVEDAGAGH
jgi:hypothetical protein